jgi:hypothetical protein
MSNKKQILMFTLGIILLPLLLSLYLVDRVLLLFLFHLAYPNIQSWWRDSNQVGMSIIRITVVTTLVSIAYLISMWI